MLNLANTANSLHPLVDINRKMLVLLLDVIGLLFMSLGPCFENNGHPVGDTSDVVLKCDDDGTYELRKFTHMERWCVFPNNRSETPGSRVTRSDNVNCNICQFKESPHRYVTCIPSLVYVNVGISPHSYVASTIIILFHYFLSLGSPNPSK